MSKRVAVAENIRKSFGQTEILQGLSLSLERGKVMALLGPSGSGKTTLLRSVAGLERPDSGRIELGGKSVFDAANNIEVPVEERGVGMVFQSYAIWPHRSVFDNVAYGLRLRRIAENETKRRVGDVLERLGLHALAARYPHQLSGGQQQRVALARALVYNPPLILLDEPLSNLDAKLREEARVWLRELILRENLSALYVTHDQVEAMVVADRIMLLAQGRVEQEGTPEEIYDRPATLFAAEFMGANNRLPGTLGEIHHGRARIMGENWQLTGVVKGARKPGDAAAGLIRLERCRICDGPGLNRLRMRVVTNLYLGGRWEHLLALGCLEFRLYGNVPLSPEHEVWVELAQEDLWIF